MANKYLVAKVSLSQTSYYFDFEYSYNVPLEFNDRICLGIRVVVPFGRGNRKRIGFVTALESADYIKPDLKPVFSIAEDKSLINDEALKLIFWLKENTFCTYFEAYKSIVPTGFGFQIDNRTSITKNPIDLSSLSEEEKQLLSVLQSAKSDKEFDYLLQCDDNPDKKRIVDLLKSKEILVNISNVKRKVGDETVKMVSLTPEFFSGDVKVKLTPKQNKVISILEENGSASVKEICYIANVTNVVVRNLVKSNVLYEYEYQVMRLSTEEATESISPDDIILNKEQQAAFDGISRLMNENKPAGALLFGVTGSGKTSVFIKLIQKAITDGKQAMLLVPEISLTPQMVKKFKSLFGSVVAVIHSSLSLGQRVDEYKRIQSGEVKIVIGTRSAVFSPMSNIGIIIMDEEGERTYKSDSSPRYNTREVAIKRAGYHNAVLLMASATPSLESYYYAKTGRFSLFELKNRYSKSKLPDVAIVDMQLETQRGNSSIFSSELSKLIDENIAKKEQTILLLNRRGFNTYLSCIECREPIKCPNCAIALTYHKTNNTLMCHYCGFSADMDNVKCDKCGCTELFTSGVGTQRIEEELQNQFPAARVLRMDADTTYSRYAYEKNFRDFGDGKYDIMIGTQMIAKGLDFPNVTLVGVLSLDKALFIGDYRSYERTFSLITQVVGRSGRAEKAGKAIIQTFVPDHYVINLGANQDYKGFYDEEIVLRKNLLYPPFCDVCVVNFSALLELQAMNAANDFVAMMKKKIKDEKINIPLRVLGPAKCAMAKINNRYRYRIIIKCNNNKIFRKFISDLLIEANKEKTLADVRIFADINGDVGL